eukprot:scaffold324_cov394-Prasinococcus_capsulatus_cf.AAC.2
MAVRVSSPHLRVGCDPGSRTGAALGRAGVIPRSRRLPYTRWGDRRACSPCLVDGSSGALTRPRGLQRRVATSMATSSGLAGGRSPMRLIQHKHEAFWFYRFLSIVYDKIVNPGHWTEEMREEALSHAQLDDPALTVYDVGGGTGFCTLGIVKKGIKPENITLIDQSPHQLARAKRKPDLEGVTVLEGDAEDLPFETDSADRYVSAGSIEYWPEPQRGITEAYRVIKPGGKATIIGPVHPTNVVSAFFADAWMLFPTEEEYLDW